MRIKGISITVFLILFPVLSLKAQELIPNKAVTGVCYAGTRVNRIYIPPPKSFRTKSDSKGGGKITVIYSGFSSEPKASVEYAVQILESVLPSDLKMTVKASWSRISNSGVLGNSSITAFAAGWGIDAIEPEVFYPVTIAEKIAGKGLNGDFEADVELVLNSSAKWYFGTDGKTPFDKYDLVTVVIHELCHGLGFFDSMNAEGTIGYYGIGTQPIIYDKFVENLSGKKLTDTLFFRQNSNSLYTELISGQLYFAGPLTRRHLSGNRARLYSPPTWDRGSSVSHLDELRTNETDALMTPFIDLGEAIHDPGNLTLSILGDLGWINTRILHTEVKDTEENLSEIGIDVTIRSDTTYDRNMVGLVYSTDDFQSCDTIMMSSAYSDDSYSSLIRIPSYNIKLDYYFFTADGFSRLYRSPSRAEKGPYSIFIGQDTIKPVISHVPPEYYFEKIDSVVFEASVNDNLGIDTVYIEYKVNNEPSKYSGLTLQDANEYTLRLDVRPEFLKGGDTLKYRIVSIDDALARNSAVSPRSGYHSIKIESLLPVVSGYSTDFSDASADFFNSGFQIEQPSGFNSPALHSEHPYKSPEEDDKNLEFSSVLRHPVLFDASGMMITFRELVLVEPGEEGSFYGFSDFYDYVILEASKDFGKTWFDLAEGYDSRYIPSWENAYNSGVNIMNSSYAGSESMMLEHTFYPRIEDKISEGESFLIRFRLFSDPYSHGWGWVIDDLNINPLVDKVDEINKTGIRIYPNPGNGLVNILFEDEYNLQQARVSVYNFAGNYIVSEAPFDDKMVVLNISGFSSGLYFIVINYGKVTSTFKYHLIR
jgi:hypothetical protein